MEGQLTSQIQTAPPFEAGVFNGGQQPKNRLKGQSTVIVFSNCKEALSSEVGKEQVAVSNAFYLPIRTKEKRRSINILKEMEAHVLPEPPLPNQLEEEQTLPEIPESNKRSAAVEAMEKMVGSKKKVEMTVDRDSSDEDEFSSGEDTASDNEWENPPGPRGKRIQDTRKEQNVPVDEIELEATANGSNDELPPAPVADQPPPEVIAYKCAKCWFHDKIAVKRHLQREDKCPHEGCLCPKCQRLDRDNKRDRGYRMEKSKIYNPLNKKCLKCDIHGQLRNRHSRADYDICPFQECPCYPCSELVKKNELCRINQQTRLRKLRMLNNSPTEGLCTEKEAATGNKKNISTRNKMRFQSRSAVLVPTRKPKQHGLSWDEKRKLLQPVWITRSGAADLCGPGTSGIDVSLVLK